MLIKSKHSGFLRDGTRMLFNGGGGPSSSTTYTSNLSKALEPKALDLVGAAIPEYFNVDSSGKIQSVKQWTPYSTRPEDYVAQFSPQQQAVFSEAANMQRPGQFQQATQLAGMAGLGGLESTNRAYEYGAQGAGYGARAANIGEMALAAQDYGRDVGEQARGYASQAANAGQNYAALATNPYAVQSYMSPYMQNVVDLQKQSALRDFDIQRQNIRSQQARAGAFGGSRGAIQEAEARRALTSQLQNIEAQGQQSAYDKAIQSLQFGSGQGLQGLQAAQTGLGTALQGGQLGLSGIGQAIAGQQAGMQGAQVGLQGVSGAQAGYGLANQAGTNLANIGTQQQQADLARMNFQQEMGAAQQNREQQIINQAVQNYAVAQENPYQRLSQYSGLLRGYMTPTGTTSQYMAAPNLASQVGGAGLGILAASQGKKKGGSIKSRGIEGLALRQALKGGKT